MFISSRGVCVASVLEKHFFDYASLLFKYRRPHLDMGSPSSFFLDQYMCVSLYVWCAWRFLFYKGFIQLSIGQFRTF
jgi:hypothetical protein